MRTFNKLKTLTLIFSATTLICSCSLDEYEESLNETYTKSFIKTFGVIDENQDWNMATRLTANIDPEDIASSDCNVKIYTQNPVNPESRLMANFNVGGGGTRPSNLTL